MRKSKLVTKMLVCTRLKTLIQHPETGKTGSALLSYAHVALLATSATLLKITLPMWCQWAHDLL